jgi:hypothetical protein
MLMAHSGRPSIIRQRRVMNGAIAAVFRTRSCLCAGRHNARDV